MPLSDIPGLPMNANIAQINDYLIMLRRRLNDFLNHLDTLNVDELDAGVINTGVLNAALATIKSALTGATITIDGNGFKAVYTTGVSITIDQNGFTISHNGTNVFTVDTSGVANFAGNITTNANINVGTDATIGNKLNMNANNYLNGIYWGGIQIYIDPAANALHLVASGGVYANGTLVG